MGYTVWRPINPHGYTTPEFDKNGLLLGADSDEEDQPHQQGSRQGDLEEGIVEDDTKMPGLVQDPRNQNLYAALADNSGNEAPPASASHHNSPDGTGGETQHADTSHHNSPNEATDGSPRTYASVASSSSGDADDQPGWTKMTTLSGSGIRRRRPNASAQQHKKERTPKSKLHTPKEHGAATPKTVASIASDFCSDILSPIVGKRYEHNSSEEVTPNNSNDSETDKKPPAQPDIEEGIQVGESKSQETELNIQSLSSSSHQPIAQWTRLARSTSSEREARLASDARVRRSQSAKRVNTPVATPQTTQHNLTPNSRGHQRPAHGKGKSKTHKRQDFS